MDAKAHLIKKINDRLSSERLASAELESLFQSFCKDWNDLEECVSKLSKEIPELEVNISPGEMSKEILPAKKITVGLFGKSFKIQADEDNGRYGIRVTDFWANQVFLVPGHVGQWVPSQQGDFFELTENVMLGKLVEFVESPPDNVSAWD